MQETTFYSLTSSNLDFLPHQTLAAFILSFIDFSKPEGAPGMLRSAQKGELSNICEIRRQDKKIDTLTSTCTTKHRCPYAEFAFLLVCFLKLINLMSCYFLWKSQQVFSGQTLAWEQMCCLLNKEEEAKWVWLTATLKHGARQKICVCVSVTFTYTHISPPIFWKIIYKYWCWFHYRTQLLW